MAYIILTKLLDQQCVSELNMGILLKTNVLHFQMVLHGLYITLTKHLDEQCVSDLNV